MKKIAFKKKKLNVNTHGYVFTTQDFLITTTIFMGILLLICSLHHLNGMYTLFVLITLFLALPLLISSFFFYKREKVRFDEYCQYFEYMKIYFKTYKKIKLALEHVVELFPKRSHMKACIEKAIQEIEKSGDYETALQKIEQHYHNSYLERLHQLLVTGEEHGSDSVYENLDAINYEAWKSDIQMHQSKKKTFRYMLYGMTIFALGLSYYGVHVFADAIASIYEDPDYQLYTFLDVEGILVLFMIIYHSFVNKKWIKEDD